jgi:septal ring factor EnvC (AmiA/AmiB activator)
MKIVGFAFAGIVACWIVFLAIEAHGGAQQAPQRLTDAHVAEKENQYRQTPAYKQSLAAQAAELQKQAAATEASIAETQTPAFKKRLRIAAATALDQQLLDMGIESATTTRGANADVLVIKDALAGRVRTNAIQKNGALFDNLKSLGFKKLNYGNGFDDDLGYNVSWDLTK